MSLFKKFRKKRETSDKKEEISEGGLSEQDAGKKQAVKTADSNESKNIYILNPRLAIKKKLRYTICGKSIIPQTV